MNGKHVEAKDHSNISSMFAKLHQTHKFQQPPPRPPLSSHHHHHHRHLQVTREGETFEEAVDDSSGGAGHATTTAIIPAKRELQQSTIGSTAADGPSIEVVRRPRGRPPGSKNKPKPPVIITRDSEPAMSAYVLELPCGVDVVDSVTRFCRKRNMGLCVLTGSGTVANVTLKQPSATTGATVMFQGRFDVLSISATVLPSAMTLLAAAANGFTISLAGPQGQVVGGSVEGALMTAGTVFLIAASFNSPSFQRLPLDDEVRSSGSGGGNDGRQSPQRVSGRGAHNGHSPASAASLGMSIYSCHLPSTSDVLWAPTARPPPPPPPF